MTKDPQPKPFLTLKTVEGMIIAKKAHPNVVVIIPITKDNKIVLCEQYRPAIKDNVIGLPAGHIGDEPGHENEIITQAARRELLEEVGYDGVFQYLLCSASTPGMTDEITVFVYAFDLVKKGPGGGGDENIKIHEVPIKDLETFMFNCNCTISAQMLAGLWAARNFIK